MNEILDLLFKDHTKSVPKEPSRSVPEEPSRLVPKEPSRSVLEEPTRSVPKEPSRSVPEEPTRSVPKEPSRSVPEEPTRSVPKEPDWFTLVTIDQLSHVSETVTHWFTLIVLSALRRSNNENMLSLMNLILRSILTDLQVTPTKLGRMAKPYSSPRFIANCFNAGYLKMDVKVPDSS
nr:hypothetical protein [Tanacetum cinerariifolium]